MNQVRSRTNSLFSSVSYRLGEFLIDPGDIWEGMAGAEAILLTHAHFDHIYGINDAVIAANSNVHVYTNSEGKEMLLDSRKNLSYYHESSFTFKFPDIISIVDDGQEIRIGNTIAKAFFTPGHNPSCITWVIDDCVFSGDSLIPGIKTVTNLPNGDRNKAMESITIIETLKQRRQLFPGHLT